LERLVREAAEQIAELIAEIGDDVVSLRLDVGARPGLVLDGRAGRARGDGRAAELGLVQVGRVGTDAGLVNRPSVKPPWPVPIGVGVGYSASTSGMVWPLRVTVSVVGSPPAWSSTRLAIVAACCESPRPVIQKMA